VYAGDVVTRREFGFLTASAAGQLLAADKEALIFIGTYTRGGSKGIYSYRFNPSSGKLTEIRLRPSPESFLSLRFAKRQTPLLGRRGGRRNCHPIRRRSGFGQVDEA
jgi:hypothetical protein